LTKREKRLQKIRQNPRNVSFGQLRQVLEDYGFVMRKSSGTSHLYFRAQAKGRVWTITIPFKKPHVKTSYVKMALKMIEEIVEV
jgi:hypothetical protein